MSGTNATCPECGRELPEGRSASQCAHCLIGLGLEVPGDSGVEDGANLVDQPPAAGEAMPPGLTPLRRFGDYELLEEIARGGMGVVYKARQLSLNRLVAVKLILTGEFATSAFVQRFRTEASAAAVLHHPNIVAIHEVGVHDGQHYFSMDFVDGPSLAARGGHQALPARRAAQYLKTIAEAIHYAHEQGILHRDLKPSNVLIDANDQPRITDFGLAKRLEGDTSLTLSGQMIGSPNFMPPEQATARHGKVGRYSDVYGLGGILYHLLTARPPFQADSLEIIVSQVLTTEPVSPRMLIPTLPRDLETICLKCLEKEPSHRYASAQLLADELGRFLNGQPVLARPLGTTGKVWRWCRRKPALATALGAVVLVAVVGFVGILTQWRRAEEQWRRAEEQGRNAEFSEMFARQNAYASDMNLAQRALEADEVGLAVSLLDKHRPGGKSEIDLRHWEWRYLWQLCQPDMSFSLRRDCAPVGAVAVSQDGKLVAVQTADDKMTLWDLTTKRPVAELPGTGEYIAMTLLPSGGVLAVSRSKRGEPPTVEFWDLHSRQLTGTFSPPSPVISLAFSPDGKLLATLNDQGTAELGEWESNRSITNLEAAPFRRGGTGVVVFSPDGNLLAVGADYGWLQVLNLRSGAVRTIETQTIDGVSALAFSPNGQLLAAGFAYTSSTVGLWDSDSGQPRGQLVNTTAYIRALAFTPDGRRLAAASVNGTIRIWNVAERTQVGRLRGHPAEGLALAFQADGQTLVSGCDQGTACLWDLAASNRTSTHTNLAISHWFTPNVPGQNFAPGALDPKVVQRLGLAFTPDSRSFITTDPDGTLGVWDTRTMQQTKLLPALGSNCWGVALSPDGHWLAVGDAAGKVHIWDWKTCQLVKSLDVPFEWCGGLRFSHSGRFLLTYVTFNNRTRSLKIWTTGGWEELPLRGIRVEAPTAADFSPDDRFLALGYRDGAVTLRSVASRQDETTFCRHIGGVAEARFSPDGRLLVTTSWAGSVKLWDVATRSELATLRGHSIWVWSAAFWGDSRRVATGGSTAKDAVILWDTVAQRELLSLPAEGQFFVNLLVSQDGNTLVATSLDGHAHFWRAPSWAEIEAAEKGAVKP
jgi:eukaryotic-like serine/threonine-protein kinase